MVSSISLYQNERLKKIRNVSFEEILESRLLKTIEIKTKPHQKAMVFDFKGYIWIVPFIETEYEIFLKTIYPSRKHKKQIEKGI